MNKTSIFAIALYAMMFPAQAGAWVWLDIVKWGARQFTGSPAASAQAPGKKEAAPKPSAAPALAANPTQEEIVAAIKTLEGLCNEFAQQKFPCAVGRGEDRDENDALQEARTKAMIQIAIAKKGLLDYVLTDTTVKIKGVEYDNATGEDKEIDSKIKTIREGTKITAENVDIRGSMPYIQYPYKEKPGDRKYKAIVVMVLDKELFEEALNDKVKPDGEITIKSVSKRLIGKAIDLIFK